MRSFPFIQQLDSMDCGPVCLGMISKWYGKEYSLQELRNKCFINKNGVNLKGISHAAELIGFSTKGVKVSFEELTQYVKLPCIVYWGQKHFIVVYKIKRKKRKNVKVYVADPSSQKLVYNEKEFCRMWLCTKRKDLEKGLALILEPTSYFYQLYPERFTKLNIDFLIKYITPYKKLIWQILLGLFIGSIIQSIIPFTTQTIVDKGIGKKDINFIYLILFAQIFLVIV